MKVVCFGDSLTSCGGPDGRYSDILQERFPNHQVINAGVGGHSFVDAIERLQSDVIDLQPDVVLVEFGANDWWRDERPSSAWASDLEAILSAISSIGARAMVLGVFGEYLDEQGIRQPKSYGIDERAVAWRDIEAKLAAKHGCPYHANIQEEIVGRCWAWADRNHPNEMGNRAVANAIIPALSQLLGDEPRAVRSTTPRTTRDFWDEAVARRPDHEAVVQGDQRLTFAQADALCTRIAAALAERAGPRPRVAVYLPNCLEYYLLYWAIVKLGGTIVPLNTWLSAENLGSIFERVQPDALLTRSPDERLPIPTDLIPSCHLTIAQDWDALATCANRISLPEIAPEDVSIIMHTSGTTAAPKGAMMRHVDLMFNVVATINAQQFDCHDRHLLVNPMFHCTALYSSLPTAAHQASTLVITDKTDAPNLLRLVQDEQLTTFLTIPTICQRLVAQPELGDYDLSSLKVIGYAGSMMPVSTIRQLQKAFPEVKLHNFFGLTETTSATHVLKGQDAEERPGSIGRLLPFVEAIIVDEEGAPLLAGEVGELLFARENVISGYFARPGLLDEALIERDGRTWFRTGDLAAVDEEGYFFIKGRKKDMIIVGGENVYAAEVEAVLMAHDGVREAAVIGVPATGVRASLGEIIKAFVVRRQADLVERPLRAHCHQRLASFKIPHIIEFVDDLPRNPSGKVVKAELPR